jgi:hypothetical protein
MRTMLGVLFCLFIIALAIPSRAQTPAHFWSKRFGSTSGDTGFSVAVDASGNVLLAGSFAGTVNVGGPDLVSSGSSDIFVAQYNANGAHQWSQSFGSTGLDAAYAVAVDGSGNVLAVGPFNGTVNFGGTDLMSQGNTDIFVAKYSASGAYQWSKGFGSTSFDNGLSVAVDGSGNVFVTGYFTGTVNFGGTDLVSSGGTQDIFVAKYNSSGTHQFSKRFGSTSNDYGYGAAVDGSGNVFVTGRFGGTVNFGGTDLVGSGGTQDIFVAKYNSSGTHQWSKNFGSTGIDDGNAVAADGFGNVFVTGHFSLTVNFGGTDLVSVGNDDIFVAKYDANGVHQWSKSFGSTSFDDGNAVAADGSGNVFVTGQFGGTVDFGGGNLVSAGSNDIFVAKYGVGGAHQWSQHFGGTSSDGGNDVAVGASGNVLATGFSFSSTVDLGGGNLVGAGSSDIFVAKYGSVVAEPVVESIADVGNDQGRRVRIQFSRSGHDDVDALNAVLRYEAYRRNDALPSPMTGSPPGSLSRKQLLDLGWVDAGSTPAHTAEGYVMDAPTDADSTIALGQHYSVFFIRAATAAPGTFFDSEIDTGYSVDNLAPGVPVGFAYSAGVLSWNPSNADDFDFFSVYGSNTSSFALATLVDYTTGTNLDVSSAGYVYYFVTATDFSKNEGNPAVINVLTGAGGTPRNYVLSISSYPNPFNPETTVRYTLPSKGRVTIAVYDLRGAHVATLVEQEMDAGAYTVEWNGRDDRGNPAGSGVYFARLASPAGQRSYKMTLLK